MSAKSTGREYSHRRINRLGKEGTGGGRNVGSVHARTTQCYREFHLTRKNAGYLRPLGVDSKGEAERKKTTYPDKSLCSRISIDQDKIRKSKEGNTDLPIGAYILRTAEKSTGGNRTPFLKRKDLTAPARDRKYWRSLIPIRVVHSEGKRKLHMVVVSRGISRSTSKAKETFKKSKIKHLRGNEERIWKKGHLGSDFVVHTTGKEQW